MGKIHPIQRRFTAGILSPRLHAQSDVEGYAAGLSDCLNFIPTKHGMLTRRGGFRKVAVVGGSYAKALPFQMTPDSKIGEAFIVAFSDDGNVYVVGANGFSAGEELVVNTGFTSGLSPWESTVVGPAKITWSVGRVRMDVGFTLTPDTNKCFISQQVSIPAGSENEDLRLVINIRFPNVFITPTVKYSIGTTKNGSELVSPTFAIDGKQYTINPSGNSSIWITIQSGSIVREFPDDPSLPPLTQESFFDITSVSLSNLVAGSVSFPHTYTSDELKKLKSWPHPTDNEIWILSGESAPTKVKYDPSANVWSYEAIGLVGAPPTWTGKNWPSVLTFFQGRSWWGGLTNDPVSFWGSKSANYNNLTLGTTDSDAIQINISRQGKIQWMEGVRNLIIGTTAAEYVVTSDAGVITPSDFNIEPQSANGGASVASLPIGTSAFYVSSDYRKIYAATYQWTEQSWNTRDITFSAEHLTSGASIVAMAYAKNPENIIWASTSDDEFIGCTFQPLSGQVGWHRHDVSGDILSLAVIEESGVSNTYATIRRTINDVVMVTLEVMDFSLYLDGAEVINNPTPSKNITNIVHLAGVTVRPLVDGAVHPEITLDETGSGVLEYEGSTVIVGIPFTSEVVTLPPDYGSQTGSAMSMQKGWNKIGLRLLNSSKPIINGTRPPDRTVSSFMGTAEAPFTGDVFISNVGYSTNSVISVKEDLPVACNIIGMFGEMNQSNL